MALKKTKAASFITPVRESPQRYGRRLAEYHYGAHSTSPTSYDLFTGPHKKSNKHFETTGARLSTMISKEATFNILKTDLHSTSALRLVADGQLWLGLRDIFLLALSK